MTISYKVFIQQTETILQRQQLMNLTDRLMSRNSIPHQGFTEGFSSLRIHIASRYYISTTDSKRVSDFGAELKQMSRCVFFFFFDEFQPEGLTNLHSISFTELYTLFIHSHSSIFVIRFKTRCPSYTVSVNKDYLPYVLDTIRHHKRYRQRLPYTLENI